MKQFRRMATALCAVFLLCGFVIPAYAYADGGEGADYGDPTMTEETTTPEPESTPEPEPTVEPGEGFDQEGNLVTRDLLYDKHTNKQFITVQTSGGSTFYIVIDYDKPVNEEEEQYQTYFLSTVDEDDLLAAIEKAGGELPACTCTEKCAAGAVRGGSCQHGLSRVCHQHDRVRGRCAGAGAHRAGGARGPGAGVGNRRRYGTDPAHSGGCPGGRRSRVVFQDLPS